MWRVRLITWKQEAADEGAAKLRAFGFHADAAVPVSGGSPLFRELREAPPDAIVIDLDRLPSHGKAVGVALKESKSLRAIPLVFAGGAPEKVAPIRQMIPDAAYTGWNRVGEAIEQIITAPPAPPAKKGTRSLSAQTPLSKKLGIKEGMTALTVDAPAAFFQAVGELPPGAAWSEDSSAPHDLEIRFIDSMDALLDRLRKPFEKPFWLAWAKAGARPSELKQQTIRELAMSCGLVDFKVCAIDKTWAAMLFSRRRTR